MKFKYYEIYWLNGKIETVYGTDFADALKRAGYSADSYEDIDYYKEV